MSRDSAREAMQRFREQGGITSNQSATDVQESVAMDIAKHEAPTPAPTESTATQTPSEAPVSDAKASVDKVRATLTDVLDKSSSVAARASDRISAQPTPGSIVALLIVLGILVFVLVPVDMHKQYSRVQLLV